MYKHHGLLTGPTRPPSNIFSSKGPARMLMICLMQSRWICKIKMNLTSYSGHLDTTQAVVTQAYRFTVPRWSETVEATHCKRFSNQEHKNHGEFHKYSGSNIIFLHSLKSWLLQQSDILMLSHISGIFIVFIFRGWSSIERRSTAGLFL